ncbi:hypothetical protein Tco_0600769, partial [Tanacetum coccineum]
IRSPGVDGPPVMPEDPYAYVVAAFQAPSSPDYVPSWKRISEKMTKNQAKNDKTEYEMEERTTLAITHITMED